ncbi:hypothetical protein WA026_019082 [Henosepilachna vigintioctopunctata]|uniref:Conserved oligomeric Golgi complex subunit 1 n=1 Tax=Henosepilachna vigintioctopunctata TaxID=420089 RepID=A0AAW1VEG1_9CUCU
MMNKYKYNLLELDIGELFVEHKIDEILEIENLIDGEIEKKRTELRSMVGDRYKDILIASDSIKSMKDISTEVVNSIRNITASCNTLLKNTDNPSDCLPLQPYEEKIAERTLVVQIRLTIYINETIWMYLDKEDYLNAVQLYLLGQNIHTGLTFLNSSYKHKVPFLKHVKMCLTTLRDIILDKIIKKLQSVELTSEQACSNLNGLMLLQNQNTNQLISIFMDHRNTALSTVINISHSSVRIQISAMVKCLITTIHLLYDCFLNSCESQMGLIFKQLEEILSERSPPTLSKVKMAATPLDSYIPQLIREFRPKYKTPSQEEQTYSNGDLLLNWLKDTKESVKQGLEKSLELVTSIKGLHIIREEALKIGLSMKAMGFSQTIVGVCQRLDGRFLELLADLSQYLYGVEFEEINLDPSVLLMTSTHKSKLVDLDILQKCLIEECVSISIQLLKILSHLQEKNLGEETVRKSVFCIRLLQAIVKLCPYFKKCCTINNSMENWFIICENFDKYCNQFWINWIDHVVGKTRKTCSNNFKDLNCKTSLSLFLKWDTIEIQEQTEEKVFKSQIKVPLKLSTSLEDILVELNENICSILPHTLPRIVHVQCIENNVEVIFDSYKKLISGDFNQNQALQLLFDVKFLTMFCIKRENERLVAVSQEICDKLRSNIDPFDLDVFHSYLQTNVKRAAFQSMALLGCLLPSYMQLANIEMTDKGKDQEKDPSVLLISNPSSSSWFPLLPITAPSHKHFGVQKETKIGPTSKQTAQNHSRMSSESRSLVKSNAASLFGGLSSEWFS